MWRKVVKRSNTFKMIIGIIMTAGAVLGAAGTYDTLNGENGSVAEAAGRVVSIDSCTISGDSVVVNVSASSLPGSDDGKYYLYAAGDDENLVAVKSGGSMVQVSDEHYITNPEAIASKTVGRNDHGMKGILPNDADAATFKDLGVAQMVYNLYMGDIVGPSTNGAYPTTEFAYDGKTYQFNTAALQQYDGFVIGLPQNGTLKEILNSDDPAFGGSGAGNPRAIRAKKQPFTDLPWSAAVTLPPLSALFFEFRPIALRKHKA